MVWLVPIISANDKLITGTISDPNSPIVLLVGEDWAGHLLGHASEPFLDCLEAENFHDFLSYELWGEGRRGRAEDLEIDLSEVVLGPDILGLINSG